jgi:F0F1-type ATP synthase epsilon subunit
MKNTQDTIAVVIMSPETVVWKGNVTMLSSKNSEGDFDLLPDHARFVSLIENTAVLLTLEDKTEKSISLTKAVLFFQDNKAKIYIHTATTA